MIELLGVGVEDESGWRLRRVCARVPSNVLVAVASARPEERHALLDAVTGRLVPGEGRVWVAGVPVMAETARRLRARVAEIDPGVALDEHRSALWNALAPTGAARRLRALLCLPGPGARRAAERALGAVGLRELASADVASLDADAHLRLRAARALTSSPSLVVVRDPDLALGIAHAGRLLTILRALTRGWPLTALVTVATPALAEDLADRLLVLADGTLVRDRVSAPSTASPPSWGGGFLSEVRA
jgi:ABC-type phosphate/phosphonate transport system ATPase subunit